MILIVLYLNYYVYFDKHLVKYYEIKPVQPKGNLSWMFIGRTDAEAEIQYIGHLMWRADSFEKAEILGKKHQKKPWCWERLKEGGEGDGRGWNGWIASLTQWTWVWVSLGVGDGQGGLVCCSPRGRRESDTTEQLNWTDVNFLPSLIYKLNFLICMYVEKKRV